MRQFQPYFCISRILHAPSSSLIALALHVDFSTSNSISQLQVTLLVVGINLGGVSSYYRYKSLHYVTEHAGMLVQPAALASAGPHRPPAAGSSSSPHPAWFPGPTYMTV